MTGDNVDTERIVAEVLRRLGIDAAGRSEPAAAATAAPPTVQELVLDSRVVTLATIEGRLRGVRRVLVARRAVVTPAVKDELRKRRIALDALDEVNNKNGTAGALAVLCCTKTRESARLAAILSDQAAVVADLHQAVRQLTTIIADPRRAAILLTDQPLAALCLANRCAAVRAVAGCDPNAVRQAIDAVGANVLVVDPNQVAPAEWQHINQTFARNLPRTCPPVLAASPATSDH